MGFDDLVMGQATTLPRALIRPVEGAPRTLGQISLPPPPIRTVLPSAPKKKSKGKAVKESSKKRR